MVCFRFASRSARLDGSTMDIVEIDRQRDLLERCLLLLKEVYQLGGKAHESIIAAVRLQLSETYVREQALLDAHESDKKENGTNSNSGCGSIQGSTRRWRKACDHLVAGMQMLRPLWRKTGAMVINVGDV